MTPDTFALEDGKYKIRSLYFDNPQNKALMEKINGVNNREKFRIRYYNNDTSLIKLEKKSKINSLCQKNSVIITEQECTMLLSGEIKWLLESNNPLLIEFYSKTNNQLLRPKTVVDYKREAYTFNPGNVRVTMDSEIKSGLFSKDFLNPLLPTIEVSQIGHIILEVKFDNFLPEIIRDVIQTNERSSTSISKYAACRIYG
jgi:SPX domain protein involved in polyphosphate accumulation